MDVVDAATDVANKALAGAGNIIDNGGTGAAKAVDNLGNASSSFLSNTTNFVNESVVPVDKFFKFGGMLVDDHEVVTNNLAPLVEDQITNTASAANAITNNNIKIFNTFTSGVLKSAPIIGQAVDTAQSAASFSGQIAKKALVTAGQAIFENEPKINTTLTDVTNLTASVRDLFTGALTGVSDLEKSLEPKLSNNISSIASVYSNSVKLAGKTTDLLTDLLLQGQPILNGAINSTSTVVDAYSLFQKSGYTTGSSVFNNLTSQIKNSESTAVTLLSAATNFGTSTLQRSGNVIGQGVDKAKTITSVSADAAVTAANVGKGIINDGSNVISSLGTNATNLVNYAQNVMTGAKNVANATIGFYKTGAIIQRNILLSAEANTIKVAAPLLQVMKDLEIAASNSAQIVFGEIGAVAQIGNNIIRTIGFITGGSIPSSSSSSSTQVQTAAAAANNPFSGGF